MSQKDTRIRNSESEDRGNPTLVTGSGNITNTADVVRNIGVDYATGSLCSSCAIPPRVAGEIWCDGAECDLCCYDSHSGDVIEN